MIDSSIRQLPEWQSADQGSKREFLQTLEGFHGHHFRLKVIETFESTVMSFTTGIYDLAEREFVFVPGNRIQLGWHEPNRHDDYILPALQFELEIAGGSQSAIDFLRCLFSPLRDATIPPMLVERDARKMDLDIDHLVTQHDVLSNFANHGFALPTEDEWEYLCGGGTKRVFGDHIDEGLLRYLCHDEGHTFRGLNVESLKLNQHGLHIALDPWLYELVDSPCIAKGSDGGGASCGGFGIGAILPLSPHYRNVEMPELTSGDTGFESDVLARRIVRVE